MRDRRREKPHARTWTYSTDAECDANALIFEQCIEACKMQAAGGVSPFAAVKATALIKPESLIVHASVVRVPPSAGPPLPRRFDTNSAQATSLRRLWAPGASTGGWIPPADEPLTADAFAASACSGGAVDEQTARDMFEAANSRGASAIDFADWAALVDGEVFERRFSPQLALAQPSDEDVGQLQQCAARLESLVGLAADGGVRVMIDAEQTYFQPAIDILVRRMQRRFNREHAVVFNTFQCYLQDALFRTGVNLKLAERGGFKFACKFVRGAYVAQERLRATELDYPDPIFPNIEGTHASYNAAVALALPCVKSGEAEVMIASHNLDSVVQTMGLMDDLGIDKDGPVYFGQLLGMADHISGVLGQEGYRVYKYVPYGPVHECVAYLIRRIEENSSLLGSPLVAQERASIETALRQRALHSQ